MKFPNKQLVTLGAAAVGLALLPAAVLAEPAAAGAIDPCSVTICGDPGVLFDEGRSTALLSGGYIGSVRGDFGSQAPLSLIASGPATALSASFRISSGLKISCHGEQSVGSFGIGMTGRRSAIAGDGSSLYNLRGRFEYEAQVHVVVDVTVTGATLSANRRTFAGTAVLNIRPDYATDCTRTVSFTTQATATVVVPSVVGMRSADADTKLRTAGLSSFFRPVTDDTCNNIGLVAGQSPVGGAVELPGSTVTLDVYDKPSHPCP